MGSRRRRLEVDDAWKKSSILGITGMCAVLSVECPPAFGLFPLGCCLGVRATVGRRGVTTPPYSDVSKIPLLQLTSIAQQEGNQTRNQSKSLDV